MLIVFTEYDIFIFFYSILYEWIFFFVNKEPEKLKKCQKADINKINTNEITGKFCAFKNDIPLEEMNIGMGDIFIKMAR